MIVDPQAVPLQQEQIIERKLAACGLATAGLSVRYEDELQSIAITVGTAARVAPRQFGCIREASAGAIVTFDDAALQAAYDRFLVDLYRPQMIADATATARKLGLLPGFPRRSSFAGMTDYARALEKLCGVNAGEALKVAGDKLTFDPPRGNTFAAFRKRYGKLIAAILYASAIGDADEIGFIGNEKLAEPGTS